jgi:hypothetical protein
MSSAPAKLLGIKSCFRAVLETLLMEAITTTLNYERQMTKNDLYKRPPLSRKIVMALEKP